jgi:hypothetical protein
LHGSQSPPPAPTQVFRATRQTGVPTPHCSSEGTSVQGTHVPRRQYGVAPMHMTPMQGSGGVSEGGASRPASMPPSPVRGMQIPDTQLSSGPQLVIVHVA